MLVKVWPAGKLLAVVCLLLAFFSLSLACRTDSECANSQACQRGKCVDPCFNFCGQHTLCEVIDHKPTCQCKPGYTSGNSDPRYSCYKAPVCRNHDACGFHERCMGIPDGSSIICQNPCKASPCGPNSVCSVWSHIQSCTCKPGFDYVDVYEKIQGCKRKDVQQSRDTYSTVTPTVHTPSYAQMAATRKAGGDCTHKTHCLDNEACYGNKCQDLCSSTLGHCGPNMACTAKNHDITCECLYGYERVSETEYSLGCRLPAKDNNLGQAFTACTNDNSCNANENCQQNKCVDVCKGINCGENAHCTGQNHGYMCVCNPGFVQDPNGCKPLAQYNQNTCSVNDDCGNTEICLVDTKQCEDPCLKYSPCGENSVCTTINQQMYCSCKADHIPLNQYNINAGCKRACRINTDCLSNQTCTPATGQCEDPCIKSSPCGQNSICTTVNHTMQCSCEQNYTPINPNNIKAGCKPACRWNADCAKTEICSVETKECENPCLKYSPCGENSVCTTINQQMYCSCKADHIPLNPSNINAGCKRACKINTDCPSNQTCTSSTGECEDPCIKSSPCGQNSICTTVKYAMQCSCEQNYTPINPNNMKAGCKPVCKSDHECNDNEKCLKGSSGVKTCEDPCPRTLKCGQNTNCVAKNHKAECVCVKDHVWNEPKNTEKGCRKIECRNDGQCASGYRCRNYKCEVKPDPCKVKCGPNTWCEPIDDFNAKCTCKNHYVGDPYNMTSGCVYAECMADNECRSMHFCNPAYKCEQRPCSDFCGVNTDCKYLTEEKVICGCKKGFEGNAYDLDPNSGCKPGNGQENFVTCFQEDPHSRSAQCVAYRRDNNKQFKFMRAAKATWFEALQHCENEGKMLAMIENYQEMEWISNELINSGKSRTRFWIAGSDWKKKDRFQWLNGVTFRSISFSSWAPSHPLMNSSKGRQCLVLYNHFWETTTNCDERLAYICQDKQ